MQFANASSKRSRAGNRKIKTKGNLQEKAMIEYKYIIKEALF